MNIAVINPCSHAYIKQHCLERGPVFFVSILKCCIGQAGGTQSKIPSIRTSEKFGEESEYAIAGKLIDYCPVFLKDLDKVRCTNQ